MSPVLLHVLTMLRIFSSSSGTISEYFTSYPSLLRIALIVGPDRSAVTSFDAVSLTVIPSVLECTDLREMLQRTCQNSNPNTRHVVCDVFW